MISDHVDQETLVEKSFSYANAHTRVGHVPDRTALARQQRLSKMEEELAKTKQNVVKHVLHSRKLEKSIVQAQLIEEALQIRLETSLGLHNGRYAKYLQMITTKKFDFSLNDHAVYTIEMASALNPAGLGRVLYSVLGSYDDGTFAEKLDSIDIDPSILTPEFFFKISSASSNGAIKVTDSDNLFHKADQVVATVLTRVKQGKSVEILAGSDARELKWKLLKRLLRRKLLLIKLTMTVFQSPEYHSRAVTAAQTLHARSAVNTAGSTGTALSIDTTSTGPHSNAPLQSSRSETKLLISPGRLRSKDLLSTSLDRSRAKQADLKAKISHSILSMYGADILPPEVVRQNKTALLTFRKVGAEKIFSAVEKLHLHFLKSVITLWRKAVEVVRVETMCLTFQQRLAAFRMLQVLEFSCARSIYGAMQTMKDFVARQRESEYHGAVQQLQRCWRGSLGRHRVKMVQRNGAATTVQSLIRVYLAKKTTREMMRIRRLRNYVRKIEHNWKSHVWQRTMKKVFILQKTIRKAKIIQRVYRGYKGRQRYAQLDFIRKQGRSAVKFQCVWRRYRAIMRVEIMLLDRKGRASAVLIQKTFRGFHKRVAYRALRLIHRQAKVLQYLCLRHKAYKEMMRRKKIKCAIIIQRIVRGKLARKRVALIRRNLLSAYEKYWAAVKVVAPIILGYAIRKRWAPRVKAHLAKRQAAARVIQAHLRAIVLGQKARIRVRQLRAERSLFERQNRMVVAIQRRQRGIAGREKARRQKKKVEQQRAEFNRLPYYYRMKEEYYRTQNMYHRSKVVKIQCAIRCRLARDRVRRVRQDQKARVIQRMVLRKIHETEAKAIVAKRKQEIANRIAMIASAQLKLVLFMRRKNREFSIKRRMMVKIIKGFLFEAKLCRKLRQAKANYRVQTSRKYIETKAVVKIQAVVRGKQAKNYVERSRKRLERQRQARRIERRQKAALKIQCRARIYLAKRKARKKRELKEEEERERKEFEDLEASLEGLHEDFMKELLVIRAQKGARSMIARNNFVKRVAEAKAAKEKQIANAKFNAAQKIQAMIRGVLGRMHFKKNLPQLRRAQKMRSYCCECEATRAVRRCRQCKDKYCATCYEKIHAKGNRRTHGWDHIRADVRAVNTPSKSRGKLGLGNLDEEATAPAAASKGRKQDWQEFYDESARAKYWFNKVTGEASWTQPFG